MALSFKYTQEEVSGGVVQRPKVPATLSWNGRSQRVLALLDSGADTSLMNRSLAEVLGMDLAGKPLLCTGVGGAVRVVPSSVDVTIGDGSRSCRLRSVPFDVMDAPGVPVLLGRRGFFEAFDVTFRERARRVTLRRSGSGRAEARPSGHASERGRGAW